MRTPLPLVLLSLAIACDGKPDPSETHTGTPGDTDTDTDSDSDTDSDTDADTDTDSDADHTGAPTGGPTPIAWSHNCFWGNECAVLQVPYDHADPTGPTFPLPLGRIPASGDPADYKGVLVANFGGPGAEGISYLTTLQYFLGPVAADYDLVSFDPRGSGEWTGGEPLGCALDGTQFDAVLDAYDGSTEPASLAALEDAQRAFYDACRATNPELVDHMGLLAWADDLEAIRVALGVDKLSYYGVSGGTSLGLVYAERYPDKVDRFVLDSVIAGYGGNETFAEYQSEGIALQVQAWADWCEADGTCPVHDDPMGALTAVLDQARTSPMEIDGRALTYGRAFFGVAYLLYSEYSWPTLAWYLDLARSGDGASLLQASDWYFGRDPYGYGYGTLNAIYYHTVCADSTAQPTSSELEARVADAEATWGTAGGMTRGLSLDLSWCTAFGPGLDPVPAPTRAPTAPPFLLLNSTGDLATPLSSAQDVRDTLENGSPLVVQQGETHGVLFSAPSDCVPDAVLAFYLDGTLPADGTVCR